MSKLAAKIVEQDIVEGSFDRPISISLLAIWLAIGGGAILVPQLLFFGKLNGVSSALGISSVLLQGSIAFLGLLGLAAAVGMWLGKKWGWWLALFYFAYAATRDINVLLTAVGLAAAGEAMGSAFVKYGAAVLWNGLLLFYLCRETASTYFRTTETRKALLLVFALCLALFAIASLWQMGSGASEAAAKLPPPAK